ncbi:MAG: creatininase family protein [Phycisphaerales bacterium]|nr:MAG: creatininase family protein [Phycisphaerales bacterium]
MPETTSHPTIPTAADTTPYADPNDNPLTQLCVIDRLIVGPVKLEPQRLTAPYVVEAGGQSDVQELAYRYEENVFQPDVREDRNLAAMIAAQVALNYGLFCRQIVFRGPFDKVDVEFLTAMAENTACEIYVKKFLEPNPFLVGDVARLPVVKLPRYCAARLIFEGAEASGVSAAPAVDGAAAAPWPKGEDRCLVLSSGGKDSLLTLGLLREAGVETHPIFINESGRHWFTALNSYRHFSESVPHTGRVWTSADRVFTWMLRKFPFIRPDFADVRADIYPIRLWTVAVFLFGALPIARARGTDRVIIGDEYDTTERAVYEGIPHFSGLFDQSRFFDEALSRYYAAKRWGLSQFSLLRPLSELLIEKTLAERYPDLLALQMSCHATHKEGDRVFPCGKCEKCRRIVGMLKAIGKDPAACGYTPQQVEQCMADLVKQGVHQEAACAEHVGFLLKAAGLIDGDTLGGHKVRPHPEVVQLRFDRERSPVEGIPVSLRTKVYPLLLRHAQGASRRQGRVWTAFNPLSHEALARPYPFERKARVVTIAAAPAASTAAPTATAATPAPRATAATAATHPPADAGADPFLLGELSWPQAEARFKKVDIALLPVGAIEQHGPHLPLDTDAYDAQHLAMEVARACSAPRPFVLPLIPYGVSYHHEDFRGTISVTNETLSRLVYEIGMNVARNGITKLVIINGHGGNAATLHFAAQMINRDAHIFTCVDTGETSDTDIDQIAETPGDIHAGEVETSTSLATRPHLVDMSKAKKSVPKFSSRYLDFSSRRRVDWYARTRKISPTGVMGDPSKATREKGEQIWSTMIRNLVELVEHLKDMSLDEIHQRNRF